jgi:hypothetical protein
MDGRGSGAHRSILLGRRLGGMGGIASLAHLGLGPSSDQRCWGAHRSGAFAAREHMPDGLGELPSDVDSHHLRAALSKLAALTISWCHGSRIGVALRAVLRGNAHRSVAALCLAVLLLVPAVLSGHHHAFAASSTACATCVLLHHAPATAIPACVGAVLSPSKHPVEQLATRAPGVGHLALRPSRAPPRGAVHPTA